MTRGDERRPSRRGILLSLLPLALLAAALVPAPAQADIIETDDCTYSLASEGGNSATLDIQCEFEFEEVVIEANRNFLAIPLAPSGAGAFVCTPGGTDTATCTGPASDTITVTLLAGPDDVCGEEGGDPPLELDVEVSNTEPVESDSVENLRVNCPGAPTGGGGTTTTTPTTTTPPPSASGAPSGTDGDGGGGGVSGDQDDGQVPVGGVQSGAGGTAPADDAGTGLLAAVVGLMLAATLGLGIARVRSVRG